MILKYQTGRAHSDGRVDSTDNLSAWRIIDNIQEVDILPPPTSSDKEYYFAGAVAAIAYTKNNEHLTQAFSGEAYLMNDSGKTIQRIAQRHNGKTVSSLI